MTTTIKNNERIFYIANAHGSVVCNLIGICGACAFLQSEFTEVTIKHIWNGKLSRISKKDVKAMLKAAGLQTNFSPLLQTKESIPA